MNNDEVKKSFNKFFAQNAIDIFERFSDTAPKNVILVNDFSDGATYYSGVKFHKEVLMACSDYFKKLFDGMFYNYYSSEKKEYVIPMEGCSSSVLQSFKYFVYTGEVDIKTVQICNFFCNLFKPEFFAGFAIVTCFRTKIQSPWTQGDIDVRRHN